jgi:hypothetical protein
MRPFPLDDARGRLPLARESCKTGRNVTLDALDHADLEGSRERGEVSWRGAQLGLAGPVRLLQYSSSMIPRSSRPSKSLRAGSARGVSRSFFSALTVGAPLLLLAQSLTSCGSDDDGDAACPAGEVRACIVTGNSCEASQTCATDGTGYSVCACNDGSGAGGSAGAAGTGGGANAGAAGAAGAGPVTTGSIFSPDEFAVGSPCTTDAECPVGPNGETPLTCVTQNSTVFGPGGPQEGYCTLPCADSDACAAVDAPSVCGLRDEAGNGYCFRLCQPGLDGAKCSGLYQACITADAEQGIGICFPICTSDLSCGEGLFCNLTDTVGALCTAEERTGGEVGAPCTVATEDTDCKSGLCVELGGENPTSFCSNFCTYGNFNEGCGFNPDSGEAREAVCGLPADPGGDVLDLGLCIELCDTAADCGQPGWTCDILAEDAQTALGRAGQCLPPGAGGGADAGVVTDAG